MTREDMNTEYRKVPISHAGIAVFVFGNKLEDGRLVNSQGVEEEFNLAREQGLSLVPIGATGYMAKTLWDRIMKNFNDYLADDDGLRETLGDEKAEDAKLSSALMQVLTALSSKV